MARSPRTSVGHDPVEETEDSGSRTGDSGSGETPPMHTAVVIQGEQVYDPRKKPDLLEGYQEDGTYLELKTIHQNSPEVLAFDAVEAALMEPLQEPSMGEILSNTDHNIAAVQAVTYPPSYKPETTPMADANETRRNDVRPRSTVHIKNAVVRAEAEIEIHTAMVVAIDEKIAALTAEREDLTGVIAMNRQVVQYGETL